MPKLVAVGQTLSASNRPKCQYMCSELGSTRTMVTADFESKVEYYSYSSHVQ